MKLASGVDSEALCRTPIVNRLTVPWPSQRLYNVSAGRSLLPALNLMYQKAALIEQAATRADC